MMSGLVGGPTLAYMIQVSEPTDLHAEHLRDWREASKRVGRAYNAWNASTRSDRHRLYLAFLESLRHEEQAARRVERDASRASS
jgi:hypothetical protein